VRFHLNKTISFEVKNGITVDDPNDRLVTMICDHYCHDNKWNYFLDDVVGMLYDLDTDNFYSKDKSGRNSKITTQIKKELYKIAKDNGSDKKIVDRNYDKLALKISKLYSSAYKLKAYWGDKNLLGEGVYEPHPTCLGDHGEYKDCKKFLTTNKRFQVLVLENTIGDKKGRGRCITYLPGKRNIILFNFYQFRMELVPRVWVEAIRRLFNLEKVKFGTIDSEDLNIPVYQNEDAIRIYDVKSRIIKYGVNRIFNCPYCLKPTEYKNLIEGESDDYLVACKKCFPDYQYYECYDCGESKHRKDMIETNDGVLFCVDCVGEE